MSRLFRRLCATMPLTFETGACERNFVTCVFSEFVFRPAVYDMAKKRVAFHSELGVQYLCSLQQASLEWKLDGCRENTPLLRERFTQLLHRQSACAGFLFWAPIYLPKSKGERIIRAR